MSRFAAIVERLRHGVLVGTGRLAPEVRQAAAARQPAGLPEHARAYVDKLHTAAYRVTDDDVAALRATGWGDEEIFEITVASAVGAGLSRLAVGQAALAGALAGRAGKVR